LTLRVRSRAKCHAPISSNLGGMTYALFVFFSCLLHSEPTNQRFKFSVNPEPLNP
jgi:hypothetical protein